jgi:hypothetical protein
MQKQSEFRKLLIRPFEAREFATVTPRLKHASEELIHQSNAHNADL